MGIPEYNYWSRALHGILNSGQPPSIRGAASGSTWDPDLVQLVVSVISDETAFCSNWRIKCFRISFRMDRSIFKSRLKLFRSGGCFIAVSSFKFCRSKPGGSLKGNIVGRFCIEAYIIKYFQDSFFIGKIKKNFFGFLNP